MVKLVYAITGPRGCPLEEFSGSLRTTIGPTFADELRDRSRVRARVRDEGLAQLMAGTPWLATVGFEGQQLPIDAILDVQIPHDDPDLERAHAVLVESTTTHQGWRVEALTLADNRQDGQVGELSDYLGGGAFIRRVPGMSRQQFWMHWQIHGAYGMANAKANGRPVLRQIYNLVIEPVTATSWVLDGYEEAAMPPGRLDQLGPASAETSFDDIAKGPGETQFFRMPSPVLFGHELLIAS